jgi:hypothetical protein
MKAIVAAALIALMPATALADDALLAKMAGQWTGRGTLKLKPEAEAERVYCKIANTLSDDGKVLSQKGRCSLASSSGRVDGEITALGGGKYSGSLASLASRGPATLTGSGSGARLTFEASFVDTLTGNAETSANTLDVLAGGYRITTTRKDPKTGTEYTYSTITFTPD